MDSREPRYALIVRFSLASLVLLVLLTANLRLFLAPGYVSWQHSRLEAAAAGASVASVNDASVVTIIDYLNNRTDVLPGLTKKEVDHLADVRRLLNSLSRVTMGASVALLAALALVRRANSWSQTARHLAWAAGASGGFILLFLAALFINFSWIFTRLHQVFFTPDSWLFTRDTLLIRAFPEQFWMATGTIWISLTLIELLVIAVAAGFRAGFTQEPN